MALQVGERPESASGAPPETRPPAPSPTPEEVEVRLLLEGIHERWGYDFRGYAPASIRRRLRKRMLEEGLGTLSALQERILRDADCLERLLLDLSIHVTALFRDPEFYRALRGKVVPILRTYPFVRIWHAGCATGEEAYSLAILLHEEGLYDRARIYATDMNEAVLRRAQAGIVPLEAMKEYTENYQRAGGTADFSAYYVAGYDGAVLRTDLKRHIVFAPHNLATDGPFNEFHLILCRNVLIYFDDTLRRRVLSLFHESLGRRGILALGAKESLRFTPFDDSFDPIDERWRIYRRRT